MPRPVVYLGPRSVRHLRRFYGFDPRRVLFRALRDLWRDDAVGQPLVAMLCALARDPVLRAMAGESAIDPRAIRPDLDLTLAEFLVEAWASYRAERFATAQDTEAALSAIRNGAS